MCYGDCWGNMSGPLGETSNTGPAVLHKSMRICMHIYAMYTQTRERERERYIYVQIRIHLGFCWMCKYMNTHTDAVFMRIQYIYICIHMCIAVCIQVHTHISKIYLGSPHLKLFYPSKAPPRINKRRVLLEPMSHCRMSRRIQTTASAEATRLAEDKDGARGQSS